MKANILRTAILSLTIIAVHSTTNAQIFLQEGFESGARPTGWTNEYVSGSEVWRYRNGGFNPNDPNNTIPAGDTDIARNPSSAYSGTYNAFFQIQGNMNEKTKLITPPINLEGARKPELSFWLAQMTWTKVTADWDVLRVYYKTAIDQPWVLLSEFLDPVEEWTKIRINLPEPTSTYYIAFEAHNRWGFGVCIDEVIVEEKDIIPRYVSQLSISHPTLTFVPTGSNNVPILRMDVNITGNTGTPTLESLNLKSLNTSDGDIAEGGVKLYYTSGQTLNLNNPVGSGVSFVGGSAEFTGLNLPLPSGDSYIWITYNVKADATHGNYIDAMLEAESILLNDTLYPATTQSPPGRRTINKTVYFEDFEDIHNWDLISEFQIDIPDGTKGGTPGNPNVSTAYSGTKILGTDLTGLGSNPGNYEPNLTLATAYTATSPLIDLFFYKNIKLQFQRHLNVDWQDKSTVEATNNSGTSWTNIWENSNLITEYLWSSQNYTIPTALERTGNFKLRYRLGPTSPSGNYSGWNIDDVIVTAEFIAKDASITEWISPSSGCGHTATENVVVRVANLGGEDITTPFPVSYSLNGGATWVTATVSDPIPVGESIVFTFPNTINLTVPGLRSNVRARTELPGDQATENNQLSTSFYVVPTYSSPFSVDFESNDGYWRPFGASLWQYGSPTGDSIKSASSGLNVWATDLSKTYESIFLGEEQIIFSDDFETDLGWSFTPEFERGNAEWPKYPYEGSYYIGTDISGQGDNPYYYENGITPASSYKATSPAINVNGFSDITLEFRRNLSITLGDYATLEFSPDNGTTWIPLWDNEGAEIYDNEYIQQSYPIDNEYSGSTQMLFRFALTQTSAEGTVELGWSIDNFTVKGKPVTPEYAYLESPCFDLSASVKPIVEAKLWVETEENIDGVTLLYTIDGGITWEHFNASSDYNTYWNWYTGHSVSALGQEGWSGTTGGWITVKQTLPPVLIGEPNVKFRFAFLCDQSNNNFDGVAIDDVKIYEAPRDLGVTEILNMVSTCELSNEEELSIRIENFGIKDLTTGEKIEATIHVDYEGDHAGSDQSATEEITLASPLAVGATLDYTFIQKFDLSAPGNYTFTANTAAEDNPTFYSTTHNDTASVTITVQRPFIDLGPNIYTVLPDTVLLEATSPLEGITYKWFDNEALVGELSTASTFMVPSIDGGDFWVRLENSLGCTSVDHILVQRLLRDVGVSSFESPNSSCELIEQTPFSVWVRNFGTDTLLTDSIITLGYQIEALPEVENIDYTLTSNLLPGDSVLVTFTGAETDMRALTTYQRKAWASVLFDYDDTNDLLDKTITVWGYPTFAFTDPNIVEGEINHSGISYTLDAGDTWTAYYWHRDESTDRYFTMDTTGLVTVTVFDEHMCPDTGEVYVNLEFTSLGVVDIISPHSSCESPSAVIPEFKIQNLGTSTIPPGSQVTFGYKLNGVTQDEVTYSLLGSLAPGAIFSSYFSNSVDISAVGTYTFDFYATFDGDPKPEDDQVTHIVHVYGYPDVDLGEDVYTRNLTCTLDAGDVALEYLWSTGETTRTIDVTEDGEYSVTASSGGNCEDSDMVNVTFLRHDYSVTAINNPTTSCSEEMLQTISASFTNVGNDTLKTGSAVQFSYTINTNTPVNEEYTLTSDLIPGDFIDFSFAQKVDFSIPGQYSIEVVGSYAGDFVPDNDGTSETIDIYDLPTVYLGPDTVIRSGLITLDAGPDLTYLWSDASTMQTLDVTETGIYSVTVTNANSCTATDEISIISLTPDYGVVSMSTPISGCSLSSAEVVSVMFKNHGNDTLYEDQTIELRLYLNGVLQSTEQYTILEEFYPGDELAYTFSRKINLSNAGSYTVRAETYHPLDQNSSNDGFNKPVDVWGNPSVTHTAIDPNALCLNNAPIDLSGGSPAGGTYSGSGMVGNQFDPSLAGAGISFITYTYVEPVHGCLGSHTLSVTVLDLPDVTLDAFDPTCDNSTPITLTQGSPSGGVYGGEGVTDGIFYPAVVGAGTYTISYSISDGNGCTNTATQDIVVNAKPEVTLSEIPSVCISAAPFTLTGGSPSGGTYSGTGVSGDTFNPTNAGVGTHTITYSFTNAEGCTDIATRTITVNPLPVVTLSSFGIICVDSEPLDLTGGSPTGGTYSGIGVSDGIFNPSNAGLGETTIFYSYTDANSCSSSANALINVVDIPVVELADFDPVCANQAAFELTGGSPTGGSYSGPGVTNGIFDPGVAGPGNHTITYSYTDGNVCSNSTTKQLTVHAVPAVTLAEFTPICANADDFTLSGGLPTGGTYSGPGVTDGEFSPATAGPGTHTITYTVTNVNGCTSSASQNIVVYDIPEVSLSGFSAVCANDADFTLTGGSPSGGTFSGTGVSSGVFSPSAAGAGTHTITYSVTNANGCTTTASQDIVVYAIPKVTLSVFDPVCANAEDFTLTGGSPADGVYSGTGVSSGVFSPTTAGAGTHTITYSVTNANGCTATASQDIVVYAIPEVTLSLFDPVCVNAYDFTLSGGLPAGGTYSGTGVSGGVFSPANAGAGTHTITYSVTNANGCTNTASTPITVHPLTTVTLDAFSPACANAEPFTLTGGNPTGGAYSVNGVESTTFDPASLGSGTHVVTYAFTNLSGCSNTATQSIEVYPLTSVTLTAFTPVCGNDNPFTLTGGAPAGGTYSINGVTLATFNPQDFAPGVYTVVYSHTDGNGCTNTAISQIEVYAVPEVTLAAFEGICVNADPITLTGGAPADGEYWVNGAENSTFNPAIAGVGNHTITYIFTNANGCSNTTSQPIEVFDVPTVTIADLSPVCANDEPFALTGGSPAGGTYSINEVEVIEFNPANYAAGNHTVTYTFTNADGCTSSASTSIEVYPLTSVTLAAFTPVCGNDDPFTITGGAPAGGTYSINGVTLTTFNPQDFAPGVYTVVYSHTDGNGCTNTATSQIEVYAVPEVTLAAFDGVCVNADPITLSGGTPAGGDYRVNGAVSSTFNPAIAGVGNHTITYTFTNANGCSNTTSQPIEVFDVPTVTIASLSPVCTNDEPFALTGGSPAGGTYSINEVEVIEFNPANYAAGTHTVTYTFTNADGCTSSASTTIEVYAVTSVTLSSFSPVCGNADAFELTGGNPAGGTYSGPGVSNGQFNPTVAGPGVHTITYSVTNANGCTSSAISNIEVYATPTVNLGEDRAVTDPFTLDAGAGFASYLWHDGSTAQTYFVQYPGTYSVEVVDDNGCVGNDEVIITFSTSLISAIELITPETGECESDDFPVEAKFANKRGETIASGQVITLRYQVQGSSPVEEAYTLSEDLTNNAEFTYTFTQHLNLEAGDRTILLRADYDQKPGNVLAQPITIHPNPVFSLGDDLEVTLPYTLEAGISDVTYLWSTGSTESSIVVDEPGTYSLTVTNQFGCSATDEIVITASWIEEIPGTGTVVSVFPNPANSYISVEIQPQKPATFAIELISPSGQRVYSKSLTKDQPFTHQVDVSGFTAGLYLLRVSSGGLWISVKLVIQR
ncbi:MAG: T9SS type A sorting domain-containing protein [Tenuifilaceae bacterium]|jgi:hypothetical protein|nr:T9SS type A sorting domain-containing protein [Tenuifilaceae bacterium]